MQFKQIWLNLRWKVLKHDTWRLQSLINLISDTVCSFHIWYLHCQNTKKTVSRRPNLTNMSKLSSFLQVLFMIRVRKNILPDTKQTQTYSNSTLNMPVNLPSLYWSLSAINVQPRMLPHGFSGNFWYSYFLQDPNHVQTWHIRRYYQQCWKSSDESKFLWGKDWKRALAAPLVFVCYSGDLAESIRRQWGPLVCLPKRTSVGTLKMKKRALTAKILFVSADAL